MRPHFSTTNRVNSDIAFEIDSMLAPAFQAQPPSDSVYKHSSTGYPLRLVDWELADQTLELRYSAGYLHWDRSGKTANDLIARFPSATVEEGSPAQVTLASKVELASMLYGVGRGTRICLQCA